jgi:hypothetical protein
MGSEGSRSLRCPRFSDNRHVKMKRLSALLSGHRPSNKAKEQGDLRTSSILTVFC